jgi:hypothetical protein
MNRRRRFIGAECDPLHTWPLPSLTNLSCAGELDQVEGRPPMQLVLPTVGAYLLIAVGFGAMAQLLVGGPLSF